MLDKLKDRNNQIILGFIIIFSILLIRLSILTVVEGQKYRELSENKIKKKISIIAKRGEIRDRNGNLLAGNIPGFSVQLVQSDLPTKEFNEVSIKIMDILESKNQPHIEFPIVIDEQGRYNYSYDIEINEWLSAQGYEGLKDAEAVFNKIVEENIPVQGLDVYEQQKILTNMGITPPISVRLMKFLPQIEKENFLKGYGLDIETSAKDAFEFIREKYKIYEEFSPIDARKIMTIRHALKEQGYMKYEPLKIAVNISKEVAILIEEMAMELPGISVSIEPIRYYPNKNLAAHIMGYLGKISSENEINKYVVENGYSKNDIIGKTGIEGIYELDLRGENGAKFVEVDAYGRNVKELDVINKPKPGKDIYLTIDSELQRVAEDSLKHAIEQIQIGGIFESKWGDYIYNESFPNATSGAVVAVDVKNGEILALANFPSYDPNLFVTGISAEDWEKLQPENKRDPIAPRPLYNTATLTAVQPGSTYKMVTALAALEQGLDPELQLYDGGYIKIGDRTFGSWLWNDYRRSHGWVDLYKAIEESVNYYFFDVVNGYDYYKKHYLPFTMNTDILIDYTRRLGLGRKTGIEIGEVSFGVPDPEQKARTIKYLLTRELKTKANEYFPIEIVNSNKALDEVIEKIVSWSEENPSRAEIIRRLRKLPVINSKIENLADLVKYSYFNTIEFKEGDAFNLAIGQGSHAYTPIQMVRYISAIANGGYINDLTLIKKVGGQYNKASRTKIGLVDYENLEHIKKGMLQVTKGSRGTARTIFHKDFPVDVGAKTGTAQRFGKIPPKDEIEYIKNHLKYIAPELSIDIVNSEVERIKKERNLELAKLQEQGNTEEILNKLNRGYLDDSKIMRQAIMDLTNNRVNDETIDSFKDDYDNFAWFVAFAPYEDPQIAVAVLIFQGGHGGYAGPVAREIIAKYLELDEIVEGEIEINLPSGEILE